MSRKHGHLSSSQHANWKKASKDTIAELALNGSLTPTQIQDAFNSGNLSASAFRKTFWESANISRLDSKSITLLNQYSHILL